MSEAMIAAIAIAVGSLLTAGVAAYVALRKSRSELTKVDRNGVIEEWREIANRLQERTDSQDKQILLLQEQIVKLNNELVTLRTQIEKRETERVEQRGENRQLEKTVVELKEAVIELKQPDVSAKDK